MKPSYPKVINKLWGSETIITNGKYCGKLLTINKDYRCSIHFHKKKIETFYFLYGDVLLEWTSRKLKNINRFRMPNGVAITIHTDTPHRFSGIANISTFIEVSTHDEASDSYRNSKSEFVEGGSIEWADYPQWDHSYVIL